MDKNKPTILVVDDDQEILEFYRVALEKGNYNILTAENGRKALEICEKENVNLILLDIQMPDLSGDEVQKCIKEKGNKIGIIIVTGLRKEAEIAVKCMKMGAFDYIFKPINPDYLLSVVASYFHKIDYTHEAGKILKCGEICMNISYRTITVLNETKYLTPKEFDLLYIFMKNKNMKITYEKLFRKLYGSDNFKANIEAFAQLLKRLRRTLGSIASRRIHNIRKEGYIFRE